MERVKNLYQKVVMKSLSRLKIEGGELRILNEDEILGTIDDPTYLIHT